MAEKIELTGLQESMNQLVELSRILSKATDDFLKTANAAAQLSASLKGADNLKEYNQTVTHAIEINQKMTLQSKTLLETEKEKRKTWDEVQRALNNARDATKEYTKTLSENVARLEDLKLLNKEYQMALSSGMNTQRLYGKTVSEVKAAIKENEQAIMSLNRTIRNQAKENRETSGSINQMRAQLNQLIQTYDELSKVDRESDIGKSVRQGIEDLTTELKALEGETGRFQRNVGNYPQTMGEVSSSIKQAFGDIMNGNVAQGLQGMSNGIKGVTAAGRSLIASPLAPVIIAISVAVGVLTVAFKSVQTAMERSEERSDKLKMALAPFKGLLEALIDLFGKIGGVLIDVIVANLELATVAFEKFFTILEKVHRFTGADTMANAFGAVADKINEATNAGRRLEEMQQRLSTTSRNNIINQANLNKELREARQIARDETQSYEDRVEANKRVYELTRKQNDLKREELDLQLRIVQAEIDQGKAGEENQNKRSQILADIINLEAEQADNDKRNDRVRRMLANDEKKRQNEAMNADKQRRAEMERRRKEAEQKRRAELQRIRQEEIAMNEALLQNFILTGEKRTKFDETFNEEQLENYRQFIKDRAKLEQEHLELVAGTTYTDALQKSAEQRTAIEQKLINDVIKLNKDKEAELLRLEEERLKYSQDLRNKELKALERDLKMQAVYRIANGEEAKGVDRDYYNNLYNLRVANFEELTGLDELEILAKFEKNEQLTELEKDYVDEVLAQRQRLKEWKEIDRQEEIKAEMDKQNAIITDLGRAIGFEQEMRQIQTDYNAMMRALDLENEEEFQIARLHLIGSVANAIAGIMGKQSVFGKALMISQVAMDTAAAVMRTWATMPERAPLLTPLIIGLGAAQAVKIATTQIPKPPKFEKGITGSGYSGAAIVDEKGAEIHLDSKGNIKSLGQKGGARLTNVEKGDTIIPAHISKDLLNIMPNLGGSMVLNGLIKKDEYDFNRLENELKEVKKAIKNKPNKQYIQDDDRLIEVTEMNGNTHQRQINKLGTVKHTQSGLW